MRDKEREFLNNVVSYQNALIDRFDSVVSGFNQYVGDLPYLYDLNEVTKDSLESIFTNYWIHCNELGNKMVAEAVVGLLKDKGIL